MVFDFEENVIFFVCFVFSFVYVIVFFCVWVEVSKVWVCVIFFLVWFIVMSDIIIFSKVGLFFICLILKV